MVVTCKEEVVAHMVSYLDCGLSVILFTVLYSDFLGVKRSW